MARPKEFDESRALVDAMGLFWERGYEATTMRDVAARAGIALSSLYATFESKHALYLAALTQYRCDEYGEMARFCWTRPDRCVRRWPTCSRGWWPA